MFASQLLSEANATTALEKVIDKTSRMDMNAQNLFFIENLHLKNGIFSLSKKCA